MFGRSAGEIDTSSIPRVVILGGGYGGIYTALTLQKAAKRGEIELTLISRDNFFVFQPLLAEVISGSLEPLHVISPIRRLCSKTMFHQAEIEGIDTDKRNVTIRYHGHSHQHHIPYDHLVIGIGNSVDLSRFPGVAEHAIPFKTLGDAFSVRNQLIAMLEAANVEDDPDNKREMLTFVVAGGGYTGVEVASETNAFVREASKSYPKVDTSEIKVILLHSRDRILPELSEKLATFSHNLMERRGIEFRLNTRLSGATAQAVILEDGSSIPTRTLVAAVGAASNSVLDFVNGERNRGRLVVDDTLAVSGQEGIWAVGDCAAVPDLINGETCPPTAQYALRQGRQVAKNILKVIHGKPPEQFRYKNKGVFVPLSRFSAATEAMGIQMSGFLAWWLYRSYYLYQVPRIERKVRIVTDWTIDLLFPGDLVSVDVGRSQWTSRAHYEAGETIFHQGEIARSFYIILSGDVEVVREQDGQELSLAKLGMGEYFGEMSLLDDSHHSASVRAVTPVDILVMPGSDFTALASSSSHFGELLNGVMQQRLKNNSDAANVP